MGPSLGLFSALCGPKQTAPQAGSAKSTIICATTHNFAMSSTIRPSSAEALERLQQGEPLKLLTLAETLSPRDLPQSAQKRNSAVSDDSEQNADTHPAALEADLAHYKVRRHGTQRTATLANATAGTL
jgi:hypothetical protein